MRACFCSLTLGSNSGMTECNDMKYPYHENPTLTFTLQYSCAGFQYRSNPKQDHDAIYAIFHCG